MIERASRIATAASALVIVVLLLWLHPDVTRGLQAAGATAFLLAWLAAGWRSEAALAVCLLAAPVAPALLRLVSGREQPVLDIVWMAALAGTLLRQASWSGWRLPPSWRPLAGGWALVLALSWPVLMAREAGFDLDGLRDAGAVVSWAFWPAPFAVSWTLYWVLMQLLGLLWLDSIAARMRERPDGLPLPVHALWIGATAASVVALIQGAFDLTFLNPPFWASLGRATGTMLEANGYGHTAALAGPVAFVALRSFRHSSARWAWAVLAVNWTGVWMSGSRTAALCAAAGAVGLIAGLWRSEGLGSRRGALIGAALIVPAAALLLLVAGATGPLRRLAEIPMNRGSVADFWDRGGYGSIAMQVVREYPLTGTGAGTFHYLAPDYWRASADEALAPDNAQNWWRHQAAELGILGGSFVLIWSIVIAWQVVAGRRADDSRGEPAGLERESRLAGALAGLNIATGSSRVSAAMAAPIVRALLVGIGLSSLVGVPTQNPVVLLWFFLLAGWLSVVVQEPWPAAAAGNRSIRAAWIVAAMLAVAYAGDSLRLARASLSVVERARRFEREYVAGAHQPEALPGGDEFRWTDRESRFVLPAATPWLVVRVWAAHPDIQAIPVGVMLSSPCGVLWDEVLRTADPVTLGVVLPEGLRVVDSTVDVARTWQPSAYGSADTRELGVGISMDFVGSLEGVEEQTYVVRWPVCPERGD